MAKTKEIKKVSFATDPIGKLIVRFAIPCVIALVVNALYNIVDQIFIGWGVGYLGNGATNIVFPITIIALAFAVLVEDGGAAYLSLKLGEGDSESVKKGLGNAIVMVTALGVLILIIFLALMNPILALFGATDGLKRRNGAKSGGRFVNFWLHMEGIFNKKFTAALQFYVKFLTGCVL